MQEGSIVIMTKAMDEQLFSALSQVFKKPPPQPSETVHHMVTGLASEEILNEMGVEMAIYLDTYPEYEAADVPFDASLFSELLPPDIDVNELVEEGELVVQ